MSAATPDISVIIPAYNAASHIDAALDSVAAQTVQPLEIVVVDDGSRDDTARVVRQWTTSHIIPVNLIQQSNGGVSSARNAAIEAAHGTLLALLDSDDVLDPQHHAILSAPFRENSQIAVSFADQVLFDSERLITASFLKKHMPTAIVLEAMPGQASLIKDSAFETLLDGNYIPTSGSMIARRFAERAGDYDRTLPTSEDREFLLRLACLGRFAVTNIVVAKKRVHDTSLTGDASDMALAINAYAALVALQGKLRKFNPSAQDEAALCAALKRAAGDLFYSASRQGVGEYFRQLRRHPWGPAFAVGLQPRMIARAVACSLNLI